jgi:hypothetical protein
MSLFLNRDERSSVWKWIFWLIGILIVLAIVGWLISWLLLPLRVVNPEDGLARWRWFYDTHEAINATKGNIQVAAQAVDDYEDFNGDPKEWDWQQKSEYQRLTSVKNGYITHFNNLANDYNAKMRDMTRNWSAPGDLPGHIPNWGQ